MRKSNIVFLTTIFPASEKFLTSFFSSLQNQTYKDFDLLIVNDGITSLDKIKKQFCNLNIIDFSVNYSPAKNRQFGINKAVELGYEFIIWGDSDDYFKENRVEISINKLENNDIVVNDICVVDSQKNSITKNYFSNRLVNNQIINVDFIKDKNIFGLSNTAAKVNVFKNISINPSLLAVDWFIFSYALNNEAQAIFTNNTQTFYRQHQDNTIGIGNLNFEIFKKGIAIKINHYKKLCDFGLPYEALYLKYRNFQNVFSYDKYEEIINSINIEFPMWWENIVIP